MELASLLSQEPTQRTRTDHMDDIVHRQQYQQPQGIHQYPTRQSMSSQYQRELDDGYNHSLNNPLSVEPHGRTLGSQRQSPTDHQPKKVAFELLLDENSKVRARIPMRVLINPHDTTDSIVTTVKNFYGIYEGRGVSFEDENHSTLIAQYENLRDDMIVYVRVIHGHTYSPDNYSQPAYYSQSPLDPRRRPSLGEPFQMLPPQPAQLLEYGQPPSRPVSRVARKRSTSPQSWRGRRSASLQKANSRSGLKSRGSSTHDSFQDDVMNGYSDSDGGHGSVTSSRKARSEQHASAEISLENILQETRRKRPKFESSELPLFVPPQVPLTISTSSISPQRRSNGQEGPSPFAMPTQRTFTYPPQLLPSPQSYRPIDQNYGMAPRPDLTFPTPAQAQHGHRLRDRTSVQSFSRPLNNNKSGMGHQGILPTPDPTIASCISDEDVARQLIALGDASNFSHGRTSASTLDDAFSGVADAASSTGATSDSGEQSEGDSQIAHGSRQKLESSPMLPPGAGKRAHKHLDDILPSCDSSDPSSDEVDGDYEHHEADEGAVKKEFDEYTNGNERALTHKISKSKTAKSNRRAAEPGSSARINKANKNNSSSSSRKARAPASNVALKAASVANPSSAQSRKTSSASTLNFQHQLAADEDDLSSKPRCQRCRKSKKGCDRQRPCQRCKDAGIGIEGCVSEAEGNGRKGRYGRHMGVPVKKGSDTMSEDNDFQAASAILTDLAGGQDMADKSRKRKR